jgi:hypothetical protein
MHVYFIKTLSESPMVKIGKADRVKDRIQQLQTSCPHKLELLGAVQFETSDESITEEGLAHEALAAHRLHGEWFALVPEVEEYLVSLRQRAAEQAEQRAAAKAAAKAEASKRKAQKRIPIAVEVELGLKSGALLKVPTASEKYGIDPRRLRGRIWRNDMEDPIGFLAADVVYDDWRLQKMAAGAA